MVALVFSPLLISLTFAVCISLPGLGIYYELKYRRERRDTTRRAEHRASHDQMTLAQTSTATGRITGPRRRLPRDSA